MVGREDEPLNANKCHSLESESLIYDNTQNPSEIDSLINVTNFAIFIIFAKRFQAQIPKKDQRFLLLQLRGAPILIFGQFQGRFIKENKKSLDFA